MEKEQTLSIYRSYKNNFSQDDLNELSIELSKIFGFELKVISLAEEDGEYIKFIISQQKQ